MLQQTRVETVLPYYDRFLARFPTPQALAEAREDDVLAAWSGLGYYRRARFLHAGARHVAKSAMPADRAGLLALPGIGRYTAGAIASIAFEEPVGLVDGNVARVLARLFALEEDMKGSGMRRAEALADHLVPRGKAGDWNQALMELGATTCTPRTPSCTTCPLAASCAAHATGRTAELPVLGAKPKPKPERWQAVVATQSGRIVLAQRAMTGLFGGLWEPPRVQGGLRSAADLARGLGVTHLERRGKVVHALSHRRLTIDVHAGILRGDPARLDLPAPYERAQSFDVATLDARGAIGLATLARKMLAAAGVSRS